MAKSPNTVRLESQCLHLTKIPDELWHQLNELMNAEGRSGRNVALLLIATGIKTMKAKRYKSLLSYIEAAGISMSDVV